MLTQQAAGRFTVTAATHSDDVDTHLTIDQLVSPLWPVLLQRSTLRWSAGDRSARPLPFAGEPGWRHLYAVGLPFPGAAQGLLVVGRDGRAFTDVDPDALALVRQVCALVADNRGLRSDLSSLGRILTAAVNVAARTVDARSPDEIRGLLLEGLVRDMGMAAAVLWEPVGESDTLVLTREVGVPAELRPALSEVPPTSIVARLHRADLNVRLLRGASVQVSKLWPGMWVRLVRVGPPAAGVLGVYTSSALPEAVDAVLATLSQALSRAVHHAVLRERTQRIADALVAELRPGAVAMPDGLQVGYVYRSATRGVPIGGDFYDWFAIEPQAGQAPQASSFGVVCGDVSGKGLEAASLTTMAVYSLRAFAVSGRRPASVLAQLNTALCTQTAPERFATVAYALVDPTTGRLRLALAGHPVPILVSGGTARLLDVEPDIPAGMFPEGTYREHDTVLAPGEALVLVTDGVTEARRDAAGGQVAALPAGVGAGGAHGRPAPPPIAGSRTTADRVLLGEQRVAEALHGLDGVDAQQIADTVWSSVVDWTGGATTDDCAIVVVARRPLEGVGRPDGRG